MEEIQVGEYFRTKEGIIFKANEYWVAENSEFQAKHPENYTITKHSFNIIDLIEVGDYVNGEEITYINKKGILTSDNYELDMFEDLTRKEFTNEDIKSVVTHEQFENMKYVVGE